MRARHASEALSCLCVMTWECSCGNKVARTLQDIFVTLIFEIIYCAIKSSVIAVLLLGMILCCAWIFTTGFLHRYRKINQKPCFRLLFFFFLKSARSFTSQITCLALVDHNK